MLLGCAKVLDSVRLQTLEQTTLVERRVPGENLTEDQSVYLDGALVLQGELEVVLMADHRVLQRNAVTAEERPCSAADLDGLSNVIACRCSPVPAAGVSIFPSPEVKPKQVTFDALERHFCQLLLGGLEGTDRLAELHPLLRVSTSGFDARPSSAEGSP